MRRNRTRQGERLQDSYVVNEPLLRFPSKLRVRGVF